MPPEALQPFVGPRPFQTGESSIFFGRKRETNDLVSLIYAHRAVLLYAQSGAGKSSLLNAGVIPRLRKEGFRVLPAARVRGALPVNMEPERIHNIYVLNALLGFAGEDAQLEDWLHHSFDDLIRELDAATDDGEANDDPDRLPIVLIFDQFEELFTAYSERWQERASFFEQLATAIDPMDDKGRPSDQRSHLRIVFSMREDYVARMDSFAPRLPEQLRIRMRLERLGQAAAIDAVRRPLNGTSRQFAADVAEDLVGELLKTRVQTDRGETRVIPGEFVEPVQLQVVCQQLWQKLPPNVSKISRDHVRKFADVDLALSGFYDRSVRTAVRQSRATDYKVRNWFNRQLIIRNWFNQQLITQAGTRGTLFQGERYTGGLPNSVVKLLEDQHIIRRDRRAGARWFEITHDRFIDPIQHSNRAWFARWRLQVFGALAFVLLLPGIWLGNEYWTHKLDEETLRSVAQLANVALGQLDSQPDLGLLLAVEGFLAQRLPDAYRAVLTGVGNPDKPRLYLRGGREPFPRGTALVFGAADNSEELWAIPPEGAIRSWNTSDPKAPPKPPLKVQWPDDRTRSPGDVVDSLVSGKRIGLTIKPGNRLEIVDPLEGKCIRDLEVPDKERIVSFAFSERAETAAVGTCIPTGDGSICGPGAGSLYVWVAGASKPKRLPHSFSRSVKHLAISRDGEALAAAGCARGSAETEQLGREGAGDHRCAKSAFEVYDQLSHREPLARPPSLIDGQVTSMALSDSRQLAIGSSEGTIRVVRVAEPSADIPEELDVSGISRETKLSGLGSSANAIAWAAGGRRLAALGASGLVGVWDMDAKPPKFLDIFFSSDSPVGRLSLDPTGRYLAAGSSETFTIWDTESGKLYRKIEAPYTPDELWLNLSVGTSAQWLAAAPVEAAVGVYWDLAADSEPRFLPPISPNFDASLLPGIYSGVPESVSSIVALDGGSKLAWGRADGKVLIQDRNTGERLMEFQMDDGRNAGAGEDPARTVLIVDLATSSDGRYLASVGIQGDDQGRLEIFDRRLKKASLSYLHPDPLYSLAFHPNGRSFACAGEGSVLMWPSAEVEPKRLEGSIEVPLDIAYSPDGTLLLVSDLEGGPIIWETSTGRLIGRLPAGAASTGAFFAPDGRWLYLAIGNEAETLEGPTFVGRFDMHLMPLLVEACRRANRTLTNNEIDQYLRGVSDAEHCSGILSGRSQP